MAELEKQIGNGNIGAVNKSAHTVKIKTDTGELELSVDDNTTITVNGYYRTIADLDPGQQIRKIYYTSRNGKTVATIIHAIDEKLLETQKKKEVTGKEERKPAI